MGEPDKDVIEQVLRGDRKAYRVLVDRHKDRAMTLAIRMLKNREEAEEALQDAFVRAFRALPQFELRSSFPTWLYRIIYNTCLTRISRAKETLHSTLVDEDGSPIEFASSDLTPDLALESEEMQSIVHEEIQKLPPAYCGILTLFFVQEMSYDEICDATELPLATVKVRLFRGRIRLQQAVLERLEISQKNVSRKMPKERAV